MTNKKDDPFRGYFIDEINHINRAWDEDPVEVPASMIRARIYKNLEMYDAALGDFNEILSAAPGNVEAKTERAAVFFLLGRWHGALRDYNEVLKAQPENAGARNGRTQILKILVKG